MFMSHSEYSIKVHCAWCTYFRLSSADYDTLGCFSVERATQTEETEIVPIKTIANTIQHLVKVSSYYSLPTVVNFS